MEHKLSYSTKIEADKDLLAKGVLIGRVTENEEGAESVKAKFAPQTHAVVYLGNIELEKAEMDADGNITKDAVLSPRYHIDVMTKATLDFGAAEEIIEQGQPTYHSF